MKLMRFVPVFLTLAILLWTAAVTSFTRYGDNWALYPILVLDLIIIIWHVGLIIAEPRKLPFVAYGVVHLVALVGITIVCLMLISKDSI
jgi:hypothetical protein